MSGGYNRAAYGISPSLPRRRGPCVFESWCAVVQFTRSMFESRPASVGAGPVAAA